MEMKWWDVLETRCLDLPGTLRWVPAFRFAAPGEASGYTESQRAYHTLSHLDEMFDYFQDPITGKDSAVLKL